MFNTLILHFRPIRVPARTLAYTHTFGLGGSTLVLVCVLVFTGVLQMFVYEPSPERAYASVLRMQNDYVFGSLVRSIHHWGAHLAVVVVLLHLLRVFFTGGFHGKRQFNWVIGLALLGCILASNFTGYLLPWDQLSYWAVTICTRMLGYVPGIGGRLQAAVLGGPEVGAATVINFYALHTSVLPVLLFGLMALHFWRVRKAGGVVTPRAAGEPPVPTSDKVLFVPNLLVREIAAGLVLVAVVVVGSMLFEAPLGDRANPGMSPNPAKAPWYFLGFQELQLHMHPLFAVFVTPAVTAVALLLIPYARYDADQQGVWFVSRTGRRTAALSAVAATILTAAAVVADALGYGIGRWVSGIPTVIGNGLLPFAAILFVFAAWAVLVRRRFSATKAEVVQAVFVAAAAGLSVLTATGIWFRGAGMALVWPWAR